MGKLLQEIMNPIHWKDTYERMTKKDNLTNEQIAELVCLDASEYYKQFINEIINGEFRWGDCEKQLLNKLGTKKKRTVYIYSIRDRYILGGLYRAFSCYFSSKVSTNCFSYKRGIKTLTAIEYLMSDQELLQKYGVKLDISSYFNSVSRQYLRKVIDELMADEPEVKSILDQLFFNDTVYYKGQRINEYKSLIPGTAISSFFANYCLKEIDEYISRELGITYARYSDDIIFFADTKEELQLGLQKISEKLAELGLTINESKYEWFQPGDEITYLGLKIKGNKIDISDNSAVKFKKKIKHACKEGRNSIEFEHKDPYKVATKILKRYNHRVYKCYIQDASKFGWAYYAFRYINTLETLRELDFYLKDRIRQMITGRNNASNIRKVTDEKLKELGYVSLCEMYLKFKTDFDMYCDAVDLIKS